MVAHARLARLAVRCGRARGSFRVARRGAGLASLALVFAVSGRVIVYEVSRYARVPRTASGTTSRASHAGRRRDRVTEKLWAPWRLEYVAAGGAQEACVFCDEAAGALGERSLVVVRGERGLRAPQQVPVRVRVT